jgi:hypothetical protein
MTENSAVYDPFRPEGALEASGSRADGGGEVPEAMPPWSPVEGGDTHYGDHSAEAVNLETSRSGAANLQNPLADVRGLKRDSNRGSQRSSQPNSNMASQSAQPPLRSNTQQDLAGGSMRRKSSNMEGSMRRPASQSMRKNTMAGSTLTKRSTLASMMLHGRVDVNRDDDDNDGMGTELESGRGEEEEEEEGLEGGTNTAERLEAEQIFMPNMRREAFIPVRIARDKLKQVLKEMAQMKHMHYAALETMERQQEFLKAQLEATVATYARKLTNDYNTRVKALEGEYQRRLDGLNKTAMGDLQATLDAARRDAKLVEQRMQAQLMEKDREIEQERKMFQTKIQMTRQAQEDMDKQVEAARAGAKEKDREIERLTVELRVAKAAGARWRRQLYHYVGGRGLRAGGGPQGASHAAGARSRRKDARPRSAPRGARLV